MLSETKQKKDIYQLLDQYLTSKNIVIGCVLIVIFIVSTLIWNYLSQSTINILPNVSEFDIQITASPQAFNREKSPNTPEEIIVNKKSVNEFSTKVEPNNYYQIDITKQGFSQYQFSFLAEPFKSYDLTPALFEPVISNYIKFPAYNPNDNKILYIDSPNNFLTSYDPVTKQSKIEETQSWFGVEQAIYSPNYQKIILKVKNDHVAFSGGYYKANIDNPQETGQASKPSVFYQPDIANGITTIWIFDLLTKKYYPLDQNIKNIAWLNEETIVYEYSNLTSDAFGNPNFILNNTINTAQYDGFNWQVVYNLENTNLGFSQIVPSPTDSNLILLLPIPFESGTEIKTAIYLLNIESKEIKKISEPGIHGASWSPDGSKIIYNKLNPDEYNSPALYITDINSDKQQDLTAITLVSKTLWLNDEQIITALPSASNQTNNSNAIPANYFTQPDFETIDILYQINTNTLESINLFTANYQQMTNIHHIFRDENNIYWQDSSNKLYNLPLP